jgi:hypothetical protein
MNGRIILMNSHRKISLSVIWIAFLLFDTSLIPLATAPLSEHFHERPSYIFYGLMVGLSLPQSLRFVPLYILCFPTCRITLIRSAANKRFSAMLVLI